MLVPAGPTLCSTVSEIPAQRCQPAIRSMTGTLSLCGCSAPAAPSPLWPAQPYPNGSGHSMGHYEGIAEGREKLLKHACSNGPLVSSVVCHAAWQLVSQSSNHTDVVLPFAEVWQEGSHPKGTAQACLMNADVQRADWWFPSDQLPGFSCKRKPNY